MTESPDARRAFASSGLHAHLSRLCDDAAVATISRARVSSRALNAALRRRLSTPPGHAESLIADPAFEIAREWRSGPRSFGALSGGLLRPELVEALAGAGEQAMPKDRLPWLHQHRAWEAALSDARSVLVSSGTGSGKTECFLIPILNDLLTRVRPGGGVQAILIYPLNALIESQRERLNAWAGGLGGRVRFALYNGDTEETERRAKEKSTKVELRSRAAIRDKPPEILVTNVTMLEYMLLRGEDRRILEASEGALRWIVLDEAHSYIGSQAAEMAMLLRRVRAAFQVRPDQVRLMATSATIAGEDDARDKLKTFLAALAGTRPERCAVIEGETVETALPAPGPDLPLSRALAAPDLDALGAALASHPRLQRLRRALDRDAVTLGDAARMLFDAPDRRRDAQEVLDAAAEARHGGKRLMPWRAHLFERALGGVWVCIDPACPERDAELAADGADWPFGAVSTLRRDRCGCGAPVFELVACSECGAPHLAVGVAQGAHPTLAPLPDESVDEFAIDVEPDDRSEEEEAENRIAIGTRQWLGAPRDALHASWIDAVDGAIYDNAPPDGGRPVRLRLIAQAEDRGCCAGAADARLAPMRFGPAFLMGTAAPALLDAFAPPEDRQGLPAGGRKAISFSDSRQGVARLAARLQQDSERTMVRAFLYHAVQSGGAGGDPERVAKLERQRDRILAKLESEEDEDEREDLQERLDDKLRELARLTGAEAAPVPWNDLVSGLATQEDLRGFAMEVWKNRAIMGDGLQERPEDLARMLLLRELLRRPKVQNNPETMGLLRLAFPKLEEKALLQTLPQPFPDAGLDREDWRGLALAAVDMTFRPYLAVDAPDWMVPVIAPRTGVIGTVAPPGSRRHDRSPHARGWPSGRSGRSRLVKLVYALIGGGVGDRAAEDRADIVLDALWRLIGSTICIDVGRGEMRLDFSQAAVQRLDKAWICPVTRRPFGYAAARRSPFAPDRFMSPRDWPRLPQANRGGLSDQASNEVAEWVRRDPVVADLREAGFWTDLHDRIAAYPRYLRAQEHSAQIPRKVLQRYEETFKAGGINLLNCSTTMEMGVDIPNVRLVLNANAPPALSNYRQRVGRAGRRNEPWAFGVTFCRDLPLDRRAFSDPCAYLRQKIVAPKVLLDSPAQIARHANAMLLAAWLADATEGLRIQENVGAFLGATKTLEETPDHAAPIDAFIAALRGEWGAAPALADRIATLLRGSVLADEPPAAGWRPRPRPRTGSPAAGAGNMAPCWNAPRFSTPMAGATAGTRRCR